MHTTNRFIPEALCKLYPNQIWSMPDNDFNNLEWDTGNSMGKPTMADIEAVAETLEAKVAGLQVPGYRLNHVGDVAFLANVEGPDRILPGQEVSGSHLKYASCAGTGGDDRYETDEIDGLWKALGGCEKGTGPEATTLFRKVL